MPPWAGINGDFLAGGLVTLVLAPYLYRLLESTVGSYRIQVSGKINVAGLYYIPC